ncbi:MAG: hypothetical protein HRT55_08620 [Colwellia sp.]|nr:hypothetical protein [Colwellia sp.]NQZ26365.1 hypothetical protein [Colwellia sp.]
MAVKHIPTDVVHQEKKGGTTGCGIDTTRNNDQWIDSQQKVTCDKNGCKD